MTVAVGSPLLTLYHHGPIICPLQVRMPSPSAGRIPVSPGATLHLVASRRPSQWSLSSKCLPQRRRLAGTIHAGACTIVLQTSDKPGANLPKPFHCASGPSSSYRQVSRANALSNRTACLGICLPSDLSVRSYFIDPSRCTPNFHLLPGM